MTRPMWCSTSSALNPNSPRSRTISCAEVVHLGVGQAAGRLVEQQQLRLLISARASSTRLSVPNGRPVAGWCATSVRSSSPQQVPGLGLEPAPVAASVGQPIAEGSRCGVLRECAPTMVFSMTVKRREQRQVLERPGDALAHDLVAAQGQHVDTVEGDRALGRAVDPGHAVEQRGLAGTVRPDQPTDLVVGDGEADLVERRDPAEAEYYIPDVEHSPASGSQDGGIGLDAVGLVATLQLTVL